MALTNLLRSCELACRELTPTVRQLYRMMSPDIAGEKADKSVFTVADGLVQSVLSDYLLQGTGVAVQGEESVVVQLDQRPYRVGEFQVPEAVAPAIEAMLKEIAAIKNANKLDCAAFEGQGLTAFLDPIDGTREFATEKGEQCSICFGVAREGVPVAGLIYRPIDDPPTFAASCAEEGYAACALRDQHGANVGAPAQPDKGAVVPGLLTTNGGISAFMEAYLAAGEGRARLKAGGVGNKVLMLLEGRGDVFFLDRGVSRWDTCAAEAVLRGYGGGFARLHGFLSGAPPGECTGYTYVKGACNTNFTPGLAAISAYNASPAAAGKVGQRAADVGDVHPYANLEGMVLWTRHADPAALQAELRGLAEQTPPSYS
eukprot:TRINITY_DN2929_c0_g5_i1.p1 TRINITY_DN2929_c0_g5~~TRINITY_DN2929_c0_g5_i1.p1  ORF type:complete len:407 (+),score=130.16 TRINITY_DN2929_c0_g5_i1:108-1223(+)